MKTLLLLLFSYCACVIALASCVEPNQMYYTTEKVEYDTVHFVIVNDSIAIHKPTREVYKRGMEYYHRKR